MQVTDKGQVTIPKRLRDAAGRGMGDRREALRIAAGKAYKTLDEPFRQMGSEEIMAFLRPDDDND